MPLPGMRPELLSGVRRRTRAAVAVRRMFRRRSSHTTSSAGEAPPGACRAGCRGNFARMDGAVLCGRVHPNFHGTFGTNRMAAPLGRSETVQLLEDAVNLVRQLRPGTLVYHWIGSVPFSAGLLFAWSSLSNPRTTDAAWAGESLLLALGLLWMNGWRAIYAGKLWAHLSGVPDRPWTAPRAFQLVGIQSLFGATKLLVLPLTILTLFPWARTVAFYRNLAVLAGREDATPRETARRAHRLATFRPGQNWSALALLVFLQGILIANLIVLLAISPQIVRILTGYESAYSRSGIYFVMNPVFGLLVLSVSWILFDPFAQAVYCVRCFEAESSETGEDLRCGLRRIRSVAPATAALAILIAAAPLGQADITPADLERSVHQAMRAPEYDWRFPKSVDSHTPWVSSVLDHLFASVRHAADAVRDALARFVRWLFDRLFPSRTASQHGPPGARLDWTVAGLITLVVIVGALFAWQRSRWRLSQTDAAEPKSVDPVRLDAPDLTPDLLSEDRWMELAERCLAEENYRLALRAFYLAGLAWLGHRQFLSIHPAKTNYDYQNELNRRARELPAARTLFASNVACFERTWYGRYTVSPEDAVKFRQNTEELKAELTRLHGVIS